MIVYRVTNLKYKNSVLSGIGAEKVGGRWNEVGVRAVYCSESIALALLEYYVHSENIMYLPKNILVAKIQFPDNFSIEELKQLPEEWKKQPYSSETTPFFSKMIYDHKKFALKVPSVIVGYEFNYILNPLYKEFGKVEILEFIKLPVDERLKEFERE